MPDWLVHLSPGFCSRVAAEQIYILSVNWCFNLSGRQLAGRAVYHDRQQFVITDRPYISLLHASPRKIFQLVLVLVCWHNRVALYAEPFDPGTFCLGLPMWSNFHPPFPYRIDIYSRLLINRSWKSRAWLLRAPFHRETLSHQSLNTLLLVFGMNGCRELKKLRENW